MMPVFEIVFIVEGMQCNTSIQARDWEHALEAFWSSFDAVREDLEVEVFSINGEEKHEWRG